MNAECPRRLPTDAGDARGASTRRRRVIVVAAISAGSLVGAGLIFDAGTGHAARVATVPQIVGGANAGVQASRGTLASMVTTTTKATTPSTMTTSTTTTSTTTTTTKPTTSSSTPTTTTTTTTVPPTSTSTTSTSTTTPSGTGRFVTLPPGTPLPSDATCATRIRPTPENKTVNTTYNQTRGVTGTATATPVAGQPVTGNMTGTTDELIQWTACKWGIDEDVVRAQMAKESAWRMNAYGDYTTNLTSCHPRFRATNPCPESIGIGQIRYVYQPSAFVNDNAINSTAYNLDYTYARWRSCYEGYETWFNQFERGSQYAPGDLWGCVGSWFAGRWHTDAANTYITAVQDYYNQKVWTRADFPNW